MTCLKNSQTQSHRATLNSRSARPVAPRVASRKENTWVGFGMAPRQFSATPQLIKAPKIQTKLKIGASNDKYEQEADRVAHSVMQMPEPEPQTAAAMPKSEITSNQVQSRPMQASPHKVQRLCSKCSEEETLQAKANAGQKARPLPHRSVQNLALEGSGHSLPDTLQTFFEPRFGRAFDHVRVHTNRQANQLARAFQAKAFTLGNNIVFGTGAYQPGSYQGQQLLAHELTHVIQQRGVDRNTNNSKTIQSQLTSTQQHIQRQSAPSLPSLPDPDLECNLDLIALSRILAGDRSAALKVISCCIQTPIGRGCTKDLVDAACAIFPDLCGQRNTPGANRCPPGFRPARTTTFRGQCCRAGAVIESERDCCPSLQITINDPFFPRCCPPSQMPDGPKRNCIDKTQIPLPLPPIIIPRPQPPRRDQPRPQPAAPQISSEVMFFFFDSTIRRPESNDSFERVLSLLTIIPRLRVHIIGHASLEGSDQYNLDLGQRRADAIRNELALFGEIDRARITTSSLGEAVPAVPEPSIAGRSLSPDVEAIRGQNRRVELFFTDPEGEFAPTVPRFQLRQPELRLPGSSAGSRPKLQLEP